MTRREWLRFLPPERKRQAQMETIERRRFGGEEAPQGWWDEPRVTSEGRVAPSSRRELMEDRWIGEAKQRAGRERMWATNQLRRAMLSSVQTQQQEEAYRRMALMAPMGDRERFEREQAQKMLIAQMQYAPEAPNMSQLAAQYVMGIQQGGSRNPAMEQMFGIAEQPLTLPQWRAQEAQKTVPGSPEYQRFAGIEAEPPKATEQLAQRRLALAQKAGTQEDEERILGVRGEAMPSELQERYAMQNQLLQGMSPEEQMRYFKMGPEDPQERFFEILRERARLRNPWTGELYPELAQWDALLEQQLQELAAQLGYTPEAPTEGLRANMLR